MQPACFKELIFELAFNVRKTKRTAKFDGLKPWRCEDIKKIEAPEIGPKIFGTFGTFEKQATGHDGEEHSRIHWHNWRGIKLQNKRKIEQ